MPDLTLLYITAQALPDPWLAFHRQHLEGFGYPILQIGRRSGDLLDTEPKSYCNIYRQMRRGAEVIPTPYLAIVEDDVLYTASHFQLRPPDDRTFVYNRHRWALFTWGDPIYSWRDRVSNCALIAPTTLVRAALDERFVKFPDGWPDSLAGELGRERVESQLGVTRRRMVELYSRAAIVQINHAHASEDRQRRQRKALGPIQALEIPHWGKASAIRDRWLVTAG